MQGVVSHEAPLASSLVEVDRKADSIFEVALITAHRARSLFGAARRVAGLSVKVESSGALGQGGAPAWVGAVRAARAVGISLADAQRKRGVRLPTTIADPVGSSDRRFLETFSQIAQLTTIVASQLFGPRS